MKKGRRFGRASGFTVLELTVALVLMGFVALCLSFGLVPVMKTYVDARAVIPELPQTTAAVAVIDKLLREGRPDALRFDREAGTLTASVNERTGVILQHVRDFEIDCDKDALALPDTGKVCRVVLVSGKLRGERMEIHVAQE